MMNLIDISSWQKGIDLSILFAENNLDGVIVKATEGTGYTNPEFSGWVKWLSDHDKPFGVYHYCSGADAEDEARHFYSVVKPYIGKAVPVADYEDPATAKGTVWLKKFLDAFRELSGVRCLVYCSLSVVQTQGFNAIADAGYQLWLAQYANMNPVQGFREKPWQQGSVAPFNGYVMHQYTSSGRLNGWNAGLDFDLFNGSYAAWVELARGDDITPEPAPAPAPVNPLKPANPQIVLNVLKGEYGIGTERVLKLREAGFDPDAVQKKVNQLYVTAGKVKNAIGDDMSYLNSILWIARS